MPLVFPIEQEPADYAASTCAAWDPIWCCDLTGFELGRQEDMVGIATEVLWARSGRQFGVCRLTGVRPCREECWPGGFIPAAPAYLDGQWANYVGCGGCRSGCSCSSTEQVILPGPVNNVVEVRIDGEIIPTGAYRVDNERLLIRQDGGSWPLCQDFGAASGEPGTWEVTYDIGMPPPDLARAAVGELACQLLAACSGSACGLPFDVAELARQGVTLRGPTIETLIRTKRLGLTICDLFIGTYNPNGLDAAPQVWSPDLPVLRRPGSFDPAPLAGGYGGYEGGY